MTWLERLLLSRPMLKVRANPDWRTVIEELERDAQEPAPRPEPGRQARGDEPTDRFLVPDGPRGGRQN